jgi:DNA processing protein
MNEDDILHLIALTYVENLGDVGIKNLVAYSSGISEIFKMKKGFLAEIPGISEAGAARMYKALRSKDIFVAAEKQLKFIHKRKARVLSFWDNDYPRRLKSCHDSPVYMFLDGNADLNAEKVLGIVGTRKPSDYGIAQTEKLVDELKGSGILIVSGMAYGIDITAHRSALRNALPTVGVVAHGLDIIYPGHHVSTAKKMLKDGGILTEFPTETNPDRENFPKRNRIVAGMCDALVIVESKIKGGSLITAEIANTYNRDVFAFPGRVGDENSEGCNAFIKRNKASLIESGSDVLYAMGWEEKQEENKKKSAQLPLLLDLKEEEKPIVEIIRNKENIHIDELAAEAGITLSKAAGILLQLEFSNIVRSLPGKMYCLY